MKDVSLAQVQVLPTRLKKQLKKRISKLDKEIQLLNVDIARSTDNANFWASHPVHGKRWRSHLEKITAKRQKLDTERYKLRMQLKGKTL